MDTLSIEEKDAPDGPGLDTVSVGQEDASGEGSGLDTVKVDQPSPDASFESLVSCSVEIRRLFTEPHLLLSNRVLAIYTEAVDMMQHILANPTAGSIRMGREVIADVADFVQEDDRTSDYFAQIISHDPSLYTHSVNVGLLGLLLARHALKNPSPAELQRIATALFFHALGFARISPDIFPRTDDLSTLEEAELRMHPIHGEKILSEAGELSEECAVVVLQHHERDDGRGYPYGLKGSKIHTLARICALADTFDTLLFRQSHLPSSHGKPVFETLHIMKESIVSNTDRDLFDRFVHLFE